MYLIRTQCNSASTNWSLLLLLLSSFSHVWLCATPEMAAHQALPSLGFSRQEHWSHFPLQCMKVKSESEVTQSPVRLFATPWTAAHQAPPPMGFSRQEYWSGVPLPSPKRNLNPLNFCAQLAWHGKMEWCLGAYYKEGYFWWLLIIFKINYIFK